MIKNKKGFTLIEIIVCIVIVVAVGTVSFFGIRTISNNIRVNKLKDIEDEILIAARIYMETDNKTYEQLYKENNSVILPLNVLVNEGLLDLSTTELDIDDIKEEYVVTALASTSSDGDCVNITEGSWNLSSSAPIYICNRSNGSISLQGAGLQSHNISAAKREVYYLPAGSNYIKYGNKTYYLYLIDKDDSLILINNGSFNGVFDGKNLSILTSSSIEVNNCGTSYPNFNKLEITKTVVNGETSIGYEELNGYGRSCSIGGGNYGVTFNGLTYSFISKYYGTTFSYDNNNINVKKIRLKPCMKIMSGSGTKDNPFNLEATGECK